MPAVRRGAAGRARACEYHVSSSLTLYHPLLSSSCRIVSALHCRQRRQSFTGSSGFTAPNNATTLFQSYSEMKEYSALFRYLNSDMPLVFISIVFN